MAEKKISILRKGEDMNLTTIGIRIATSWMVMYPIICGVIPTVILHQTNLKGMKFK
ncbi:hypothetical protein [Tepidimicrobium xylanilyticum]|uniref:Uncharacterized protein n=2 Tax=Tepidimicrobium xylanilyticum TaxID=1123352 RepID=A0A1H2ZIN3_9FIRM|nr:hypothetical protein [Tepidimicrobium xylanilyticum]GMG96490.1 hypothetical protein EN5CB1_13160 [Tepidimicrobium xylanilyticum]SDX16828.1 hypothetical protein SAMN05660923_01841 [Tepidimicrobium xylanilyticum]